MSHRIANAAVVVVLAATTFGAASATAQAQTGAPAGRLSCNVGAGLGLIVTSQRPMECRFAPRRGPVQLYTGVVRSFGLDVGTIKRSTMAWRVYGPYARAPLGALAGTYGGAAAGAAVGTGGSGNLLVGGVNNEVTLQPLSLQSRRGYNVAVGVTAFELTLVQPRRRR